MSFSVYIDESGEAGIKKVRSDTSPGASPYFVLGAAVFQPASETLARNSLERFKNDIGKTNWKHATDLKHAEKVYFARMLGQLPVRYFSVVSNKATLGGYSRQIDGDPQKFYNKCLVYLLERVCAYLRAQGAEEHDLDFFLEHRNHDYDRMLRFISKVKCNPIYPESHSFSILNPFAIRTRKKGEDELLEVADFVSHAVYQCTNKSATNYNIPEPRYFSEMMRRFATDERGNVLGTGLKCIHSLRQLDLDPEIVALFTTAKAPLPPNLRHRSR
jgi:hypothetical protein